MKIRMKPFRPSIHASTYNLIHTTSTYQLDGWVFKLMKGTPDESKQNFEVWEEEKRKYCYKGFSLEHKVSFQRILPPPRMTIHKGHRLLRIVRVSKIPRLLWSHHLFSPLIFHSTLCIMKNWQIWELLYSLFFDIETRINCSPKIQAAGRTITIIFFTSLFVNK